MCPTTSTFIAILSLLISTAYALPSSHNTSTTPSFSSSDPTCYTFSPDTRYKTTLRGCRDTLLQIRQFPSYRRKQEFREGLRPLKPEKPPMAIASLGADCSVEIAAHENPRVSDWFSFEDVKVLAQDILEACEEPEGEGYGGWAYIGQADPRVWKVEVKGWREPRPPPPLDVSKGGRKAVLPGSNTAAEEGAHVLGPKDVATS